MLRIIGLLLIALLGTARAETIRVALFDVVPYAGQSPAGGQFGAYVEIAQALTRQAGLVARIDLVPFPRVAAMIESGQADITFSFETEQLKRSADRLAPLLISDSILVGRRGMRLAGFADAADLNIGRLRGGCADLAEKLPSPPRFSELVGFDSGLKMLSIGRIDALCTTREVFSHYAKQANLAPDDFGDTLLLNRRQIWLYAARQVKPPVRARLAAAMEQLRKNQALQTIWNRYTQPAK